MCVRVQECMCLKDYVRTFLRVSISCDKCYLGTFVASNPYFLRSMLIGKPTNSPGIRKSRKDAEQPLVTYLLIFFSAKILSKNLGNFEICPSVLKALHDPFAYSNE